MRATTMLLLLFTSALSRAEETELVTVRLTHEAPLERGKATALSLGVVLGPGLYLLEDAPLVLELDGTALSPPKRVLSRRDAVDPRAELPRFELEVRADRSGAPSLSAHLTAWVCRGKRCRPVEITTPVPLALADDRAPAHNRPERTAP